MQILDRGTEAPVGASRLLRGSAGDMSNDAVPPIDVKGRAIYVISRKLKALLRYSIEKGSIAETDPAARGMGRAQRRVRRLELRDLSRVRSHQPGAAESGNHELRGARCRGVGIYHPDEKRWEWEPAVEGVSGNTLGFDATNNVFLFLGRSGSQQHVALSLRAGSRPAMILGGVWRRLALGWAGRTLALAALLGGASGAPRVAADNGRPGDLCAEINSLAPGGELALPPGEYGGPCTVITEDFPGSRSSIRAQVPGASADRVRGRTSNVINVRADHVTFRDLAFGPTHGTSMASASTRGAASPSRAAGSPGSAASRWWRPTAASTGSSCGATGSGLRGHRHVLRLP